MSVYSEKSWLNLSFHLFTSKRKQPDVDQILSLHERLINAGYPDAVAALPRVKVFREQWDLLKIYVHERIELTLSYVDFHKVTQKVGCPDRCNLTFAMNGAGGLRGSNV